MVIHKTNTSPYNRNNIQYQIFKKFSDEWSNWEFPVSYRYSMNSFNLIIVIKLNKW